MDSSCATRWLWCASTTHQTGDQYQYGVGLQKTSAQRVKRDLQHLCIKDGLRQGTPFLVVKQVKYRGQQGRNHQHQQQEIAQALVQVRPAAPGLKPFVMSNLKTLDGLAQVVAFIEQKGMLRGV